MQLYGPGTPVVLQDTYLHCKIQQHTKLVLPRGQDRWATCACFTDVDRLMGLRARGGDYHPVTCYLIALITQPDSTPM